MNRFAQLFVLRAATTAALVTAWLYPAGNPARAEETLLPDPKNPDYVYCEDFEEGKARDGSLPAFSITGRNGVREGAGCQSRYGYSNVIPENSCLPPYPEVRFPRQTGTIFVHYDLKAPPTFFLGRANHGYYLYDSTNKVGSAVMDHATDHPAWLDPEWDPHTINVLRGSGYHRIIRSFEGFEPKPRGQWHSHQVMIVPSQKDPRVGMMKVWIDGELANRCKHDTPPAFDTFWISNYWHSLAYIPYGQYAAVFEHFTAPNHPAFEVFLDNLIISKGFVEFGPNKPQIECVRFAGLRPDGFTVHFDTTVPAKRIAAAWKEGGKTQQVQADTAAPGYLHALKIDGLAPDRQYVLRLSATDAKGRNITSEEFGFRTEAAAIPDFQCADFKGEVFGNLKFEGPPAFVRNFRSLSYVAWPGHDSDDLVDTSKHMSVRYTKKARFKVGTYTFRVQAYDGIRVLVDGAVKVDAVQTTGGHNRRRDFVLAMAEGEHTVVVEHTVWRLDNWEKGNTSKYLAFKIDAEDKTPPELWSQAIFSSRAHEPEKPAYCSKWSEACGLSIDYGPTTAYGQTLAGHSSGLIRFPTLEFGKTYHYRVTATDVMGNQTVTPDATFVVGNTVPPRKILLAVERFSDNQVCLRFRAPGDEGIRGMAAGYDARWSIEPITVTNWDKVTKLTGLPAPGEPKSEERITLDGFPRGKTYYFAIQARGQQGARSLLSNVASDPPGPPQMDCDGDGFGVGCPAGPDPDDYDPTRK